MGKKTIDLKKHEVCYVVNERDTVLIFREGKGKKQGFSTNVELILPEPDVLDECGEYSSVNLATAIALKIKSDVNFAGNLVSWLNDYIQNHCDELPN